MNKDFPRIMTLLRKERGLSQKQAAADLDVTQALLSHYENGKRECGLDFLVRAADYYKVSVDYLLGRSPMSSGASISEQELPESTDAEKYEGTPSGLSVFFQKKLLTNSKAVYSYISLAVYRCFRMVHSAGRANDEHVFSVPEEKVAGLTSAALAIEDIHARTAGISGGSEDDKITTARLEQEYTKQAAALLSIVNSSEKTLNKLM